MTLSQLILIAALTISCHCAPLQEANVTAETEVSDSGNCTFVARDGQCADVWMAIWFGLTAVACVLWIAVAIKMGVQWWRRRTACRQYTTSRDATVDQVYKQLRRKWMAHQWEKQDHFRISKLPTSFFLDDDQQNQMKALMNDINFYSAQCWKYFPTEDYRGEMIPTTTDFSVHFAKECAAIESFAAKVEEMKRNLPRRSCCALLSM